MLSPIVTPTYREQLPVLHLSGSQGGMEAAIQGAHLIGWFPDHLAHPVLFMSPKSAFRTGKAIRGGVPLCFPWFGPKPGDAAAPQHGFARTRDWTVELAEVTPDGSTRLVLALAEDANTRDLWPHEFAARFSIKAGTTLSISLEVRNTDSAPFTFGAALHTYLAVSDVRQIAIRGLEGTEYLDKAGGGALGREGDAPITFSGEMDRVYLDTPTTCVVDDPAWSRRIHVSKSGSRSTVIWNPWTEKARAMTDLGESAWPGFVCVETCNAETDTVSLAPQATHTLAAEIRVEPN